ncbi:MAG: hypothetical protein ACEPOZ_15935 [Marinifilaceae bacterium]
MISKEELKPLKTTHIAMCIGLGIFILIVDFLIRKFGSFLELNKEMIYILNTLVFLGFLLLVPLAYHLHSNKLKNIRNIQNPVNSYINSYLLKLVLIEVAGIFSGIVYLLSANAQILIIAAMGLVLLIINNPSFNRVNRELEIEFPEEEGEE